MQTVRKSLRFVAYPLAIGIAFGFSCEMIHHWRDPELHYSPQYTPTAVFVGGTAGIGRGMVETFGRRTKGDANIIIIGRNRAAAEEILAELPKSKNPNVKHEFIQCDVSRMKNVHQATQQLLSRHPKINFLVLTAGLISTKGRNETEEGLDVKLAVHYYSKWAFINGLMPALEKAIDEKEDGKVVSVFSAGQGKGKIDMDDLGLARTFSLSRAASHAATYNDLMVEVSL
jgi:NAD(P)-dependent dehydrogenase (short-subunit alcohol dehydrogenase family)